VTLLNADEKIERDPLLGEDTWELFESIEDSFSVDLGDYHALCGMTIAQLTDEVSKRTNYPLNDNCLSSASFYRLRRAFAAVLDIPRATIRPSSTVCELLPWMKRSRTRWGLIEDRFGLKLPKLIFPRWALISALVSPVILLICLRFFAGFPINTEAIFIGSILLILPAFFVLIPFARDLPPGGETFGGLTKMVLACNYAAFASQYGNSSESDILTALQQLVATKMVMKLEDITPGMRIPQDLNIY